MVTNVCVVRSCIKKLWNHRLSIAICMYVFFPHCSVQCEGPWLYEEAELYII